ncbi:MAG: murein L,D-transpeptidase family protein [Hyphomicrobium sp.]|jgi:murein L,D-transpeptidase YafK
MLGAIVPRPLPQAASRHEAAARHPVGALVVAFAAVWLALIPAAHAISVELKDVAPDRIDRQRAAVEGRLPLDNTPDIAFFKQRLAVAGVKPGAPVLLRVFKETSELELWIEKGTSFILFATYPICNWSGTLGPKLHEGDKQTPEGFYTITGRQTYNVGRWPRSINLGFPNAYDAAHGRDGSYILMHGGCSSVGCFAMTDPVILEVHGLVRAAIANGQRYVPIHVLPFRMTDENMSAHAASPWHSFWTSLQRGYQSFERTRRPPRVSVCKGEYVVEDALPRQPDAPQVAGAPRKKSRANLAVGGIYSACPEPVPEPVVAAAENKHGEAKQGGEKKLVGAQ